MTGAGHLAVGRERGIHTKSSFDGSGGELAGWPQGGSARTGGSLIPRVAAAGRAAHISTCFVRCERHQASLPHPSWALPRRALRPLLFPHPSSALQPSSSPHLLCPHPPPPSPPPRIVSLHPAPLRRDERWGLGGHPRSGEYTPGGRRPQPACRCQRGSSCGSSMGHDACWDTFLVAC